MMDTDDTVSLIIGGIALLLFGLCHLVWKKWERREMQRKFDAREKELADHEAWLRTAGTGPRLVKRPPPLTEEDITRGRRRRP